MKKLFFLFLLALMGAVYAVDIPMTYVQNQFSGNHRGLAIDPITGKFYMKQYHANSAVYTYTNESTFASSSYTANVNLIGGATVGGTYIAAYNGKIFARYDTSTNQISRYDAATGARELTATIPGMTGANSGFGWGGYTNENIFYDGANLYVLGRQSDNNYLLVQFDTNLNILASKTINTGGVQLGYAVMINGLMFTNPTYNGNSLNMVFNFATGTYTSVNYTLTGMPGSYRTNMTYDSLHDTMYVSDYGQGFYKVANASVLFNAPAATPAVPEPTSVVLVAMALGFALYARRRL